MAPRVDGAQPGPLGRRHRRLRARVRSSEGLNSGDQPTRRPAACCCPLQALSPPSLVVESPESVTRRCGAAMSAEQQVAFKAWVIGQGKVPASLHNRVPTLVPGMDGEWRWNRMTDDPTYGGPTCQPINRFVWKWSGTQVTVTNLMNAMGGDLEESVLLQERCPPPSPASPPPPPGLD